MRPFRSVLTSVRTPVRSPTRPSGRLGIALLVGGASLAAGAAPASAQMEGMHAPPPAYIQVNGTAQVSVPADRTHVRFAVETEAGTAREASAENAERMDAVIRALRGVDAPGLEIETSGYDLQPRYNRPERGGASTIVGYRVLNHVEVTADDVDAAGRIIDAAIGAGANRVASLSFTARDTEAARREAVGLAIEKARSEAEAMAAALGVTLGMPLEVHGGAQSPPPPRPMYRMEMAESMDQAVPTPIEAGDQTVTANVSVKFRIE